MMNPNQEPGANEEPRGAYFFAQMQGETWEQLPLADFPAKLMIRDLLVYHDGVELLTPLVGEDPVAVRALYRAISHSLHFRRQGANISRDNKISDTDDTEIISRMHADLEMAWQLFEARTTDNEIPLLANSQ